MFCSNCGSEIEKKYKFCPKCGEKIDINRSYSKMKRYGKFEESLIVLKKIKPDILLEKYNETLKEFDLLEAKHYTKYIKKELKKVLKYN